MYAKPTSPLPANVPAASLFYFILHLFFPPERGAFRFIHTPVTSYSSAEVACRLPTRTTSIFECSIPLNPGSGQTTVVGDDIDMM